MWKSLKKSAIIGLVLVACDFSLYAWKLNSVKRRSEGMNPARTDRAIVFFHDFTGEWALNDKTIRRCRYALYLFLKHRVSALVCSGGNRPGQGKSGAQLMLEWLSEHGIPRSALRQLSAASVPHRLFASQKNNIWGHRDPFRTLLV